MLAKFSYSTVEGRHANVYQMNIIFDLIWCAHKAFEKLHTPSRFEKISISVFYILYSPGGRLSNEDPF